MPQIASEEKARAYLKRLNAGSSGGREARGAGGAGGRSSRQSTAEVERVARRAVVALAGVRETVQRRRSRERGHQCTMAEGVRDVGGENERDVRHSSTGDDGRSEIERDENAGNDRSDQGDAYQDEDGSRYGVEHAHPVGDEAASVWYVVLRTSKAEAFTEEGRRHGDDDECADGDRV